MKSIYQNSILCLLLSLCLVACSNNDENLTENSKLVGTLYSLNNEDYSIGDDYVGHHVDIFRFYFHSPTEGMLYYREKDSYTDTGTTRRSAASHFRYTLNGNNVMLQYITDEILSSTKLVLGNDKLTAGDLEFSKGEISYADYDWLKTLHGTTGSCSWYSDMRGGLWIVGKGAMANYSDYAETPWAKNEQTPNRVVVEEGVTEIGSYAFANPSVGEVDMPDKSLIQVGKAAFMGSSIETIWISESTTDIGADAFADCKYLKQINIPKSIVSIGESAFDGTALNKSKLEFGGNLRTIGRNAFFGGEASYLTFAEGVQDISTGAFIGNYCSGSSKELILPNSLTSIGETTFEGPYKKIVLGSGIQQIGDKAFLSSASSGAMYVNRSTPPSVGDNIIVERTNWNSAESRWTLYVPKGCKSAYSNKSPWNKFKSIVEDSSLDGTDEPNGPDEPDEPNNDAVHFPDANFKAYMVANFDKNNDGEISKDEASLITVISCRERSIQSLEGIQYCTALTSLNCDNNQLTTLDVSNNTALTDLYCHNNQLTTLDVSKNTALTGLYCYNNQLTTLDVSKNTALTSLNCDSNQLTTLDVCKNTALEFLSCSSNQLTTLDVSKTNLENSASPCPLYCSAMSTLQTLYLKTGWKINGINVDRKSYCIPSQTEIRYKD